VFVPQRWPIFSAIFALVLAYPPGRQAAGVNNPRDWGKAKERGVFYVAPGGDDTNPGTRERPFRTIQRAGQALKPGDTCYLREGRYAETVRLAGLKGTKDDPVIFAAFAGEKAVLDGSVPIASRWTHYREGIYRTRLDRDVWQLFADGRSACSARWPNGNWDDGSIWDKARSMAWPEETGSSFGTHYNAALKDLEFSLVGAAIVVNSGSFRTYASRVTRHHPGSDHFTYDTNGVGRHFDTYPVYKHGYFLEGKLGLLDVANEWFYDPCENTLYYKPGSGQNPNDLDIRGKTHAYAFDVVNSTHVHLVGLQFFGTTFRFADSTDCVVEDCPLLYPSYSRRMVKDLGLIEITQMIVAKEFDRACNVVRNCTFAYMDGPALEMTGVGNRVENCYIHDVDYSCTYKGGWSLNMINAPELIFRRNTVHTTGASELLKAGVRSLIELNDLSRSGLLQNDGAMIQISVKQQEGSITRYNWVHDSVKQGIRFDNSNRPGSPWGRGGRVHHNVAWGTQRLFFKGDEHFIYNNLSFDSALNDLIVSSDLATNGRNFRTVTRNNVAGTLSGHRTKPGRDFPIPGTADHNWVSNLTARDIRTQLRDPDNLDFRPRAGSDLVDGGALVDGYPSRHLGKAPDIGPYEYGDDDYWIPGRRRSGASRPVPPDGAADVKRDADLMWLGGYGARRHHIYVGSSEPAVQAATRKSPLYRKTQVNNLFTPGLLKSDTTYYWRVDAVEGTSVIRGPVWSFTTASEFGNGPQDTK